MLRLLTNIHNFQRSGFKLQNSVYVCDWNIVAFQVFVVSCFGQWRMSLHMENMYRGLNHTFLVPDTLQSCNSLCLSYIEIVNWFADQLVCSCRTRLYVNLLSNIYTKCQLKIMHSSYEHLKCLRDIYNISTQKQTPFTVTPPRRGEAQDWRGDM